MLPRCVFKGSCSILVAIAVAVVVLSLCLPTYLPTYLPNYYLPTFPYDGCGTLGTGARGQRHARKEEASWLGACMVAAVRMLMGPFYYHYYDYHYYYYYYS